MILRLATVQHPDFSLHFYLSNTFKVSLLLLFHKKLAIIIEFFKIFLIGSILFYKMGHYGLFFSLFSYFQFIGQLTFNVNFADDWIRTADL